MMARIAFPTIRTDNTGTDDSEFVSCPDHINPNIDSNMNLNAAAAESASARPQRARAAPAPPAPLSALMAAGRMSRSPGLICELARRTHWRWLSGSVLGYLSGSVLGRRPGPGHGTPTGSLSAAVPRWQAGHRLVTVAA
jgi:hypothetical protein